MLTAYEISAEEVALAMSVAGYPGNANSLLEATFGDLSEDERRGRLKAAGASLAARRLLTIEGEQPPTLDPNLARVVSILHAPAFSLKYDRGSPGALDTIAYHFERRDGTVIEQTIREGVVHRLAEVERSDVVKRGVALFAIPDQASSAVPEVSIPRSVFEDARERGPLEPTIAQSLLEKEGLPPEHAHMLVEDLRDNNYQGSVLYVEYDENGQPASDHGFMMMQSDRRTWILSVESKGQEFFVLPALVSVQAFERKVRELIE